MLGRRPAETLMQFMTALFGGTAAVMEAITAAISPDHLWPPMPPFPDE